MTSRCPYCASPLVLTDASDCEACGWRVAFVVGVCPTCDGEGVGEVASEHCPTCLGDGTVPEPARPWDDGSPA